MIVTHYTKWDRVPSIKKTGLEARSDPYWAENPFRAEERTLLDELKDIFFLLAPKNSFKTLKKKFLPRSVVGLLEGTETQWGAYGLWQKLVEHTSGQVKIDFPTPSLDDAFVREHAYISPRIAKDHFHLAWEDFLCDDAQFYGAVRLYYGSTIPLSEYGGDFLVPEIWIPQKIPAENLRFSYVN